MLINLFTQRKLLQQMETVLDLLATISFLYINVLQHLFHLVSKKRK